MQEVGQVLIQGCKDKYHIIAKATAREQLHFAI